ncbi:MAG: hypothetical protein AABX55_01330, partial [Nanoarchaeota archaeon]
KLILDCLTRSNKKYNYPGGSYDTGVPPSIIAQFISNNIIRATGVYPPEKVIPAIKFFKELKKRKIYVYLNNKKVV